LNKTLEEYKEKKITLREAAELLGISYWKVQELLAEKTFQ